MGKNDCPFRSAHAGATRVTAEDEEACPRRRGCWWVWSQQPLARGSQGTGLLWATRDRDRAALCAGQLNATVLTPSFCVPLPMTLEYVSYWLRGKRSHFPEGHELSEVRDSSWPATCLLCTKGIYGRMRTNSPG